MARDDYFDHLGALPLFALCDKRQLREVGRIADELVLPAGRVLVHEGEVGAEAFILLTGSADVTRGGTLVATVGPGGFIGEMAILSNERRNATVTAATDVDVLVLTRAAFGQLLDDVPGLAKQLLLAVVRRQLAGPEPDAPS